MIYPRSGLTPGSNIVRRKYISSITPKGKVQQKKFLEAYKAEGTISHAADIAGIDAKRHYEWLDSDPTYPERFREAYNVAVDSLEREARRRAIDGVEEPTGWYKGEPGAWVKKYSDVLLIFLLKGARPEKYKDRTELSGSVDVNTSPIPLEKLSITLKRLMVMELTGGRLDEGLITNIEEYLSRYEQERAAMEAGGEVIEANYKMIGDGREEGEELEEEELEESEEEGKLSYQEGWNVINPF